MASGSATKRAVAVAIMAKAPWPGAVKTRLCPPLLATEAAALYRCFLLDKIRAVGALTGAQPVIAYTPDDARAEFDALAPSFTLVPQRGPDLGARLHEILTHLLAAGHAGALAVDSDTPTLPARFLQQAVDCLTRPGPDVVLVCVCGPRLGRVWRPGPRTGWLYPACPRRPEWPVRPWLPRCQTIHPPLRMCADPGPARPRTRVTWIKGFGHQGGSATPAVMPTFPTCHAKPPPFLSLVYVLPGRVMQRRRVHLLAFVLGQPAHFRRVPFEPFRVGAGGFVAIGAVRTSSH